jgi:tetratricopeptide (TPR) repeat protein
LKQNIFVLDTNTLLYDPLIFLSLPKSEIIIPQTVLMEIDKLKTTHLDRELRFRAREVTRTLFDLAEKGELTKGIALENGSIVRVEMLNSSQPYPSGLNIKTSDDQILALTAQIAEKNPSAKTVLISNDLNMLLKAQILGLKIKRFEEKKSFFDSLSKFFRVNQRAIISWTGTILIILIGLVALLQLGLGRQAASPPELPPGLANEFEAYRNIEQTYIKALRENPKNKEALIGLADFYYQSKSYKKAADTYEKFVKLEPKNTNVRLKIADCYFRLGLDQLALAELNKILKYEPKNLSVMVTLGNYYFDRKEYPKAIDYYEKVLDANPKDSNVRTDLAISYYYLGKVDKALEELEVAIANNPGHALAYYNKGIILWQGKGDLEGSLKAFEEYLKISPNGEFSDEAKASIAAIKKAMGERK